MEDNELIQTPIEFIVMGNVIPSTLAVLSSTTPFSSSNCTLSIASNKLRALPNW